MLLTKVFVRFVTEQVDAATGARLGIVQAAYDLWRSGQMSAHDEAWWSELRAWLNVDLEAPDRLARSRRPNAQAAALSWFRANATGHIARARELMALLGTYDIACEMLITDRPGYIVYEDEHQVAAEPFRSEQA